MSGTFWWKTASEPMSALEVSVGATGACGTRTVTRTLASAVPPSPLAVRWKLVEVEGETVCVPLTATGPMPSMVTLVASVVRQLRTTDWPRSMASGSAVRFAVGAAVGVVVGALAEGLTGAVLWWQPARAKRPSVRNRDVREARRWVWREAGRGSIISFLLR